jgi:hypothetical protein
MEGFPSKGNVCNYIIGINLGNLVEGQLTHLCCKEIDEFFNVSRTKGENELVSCGIQESISKVARFVFTNKTPCK